MRPIPLRGATAQAKTRGNRDRNRMVSPAVVSVAMSVFQALFRLRVAGRVGGPVHQNEVTRGHAHGQREPAPGKAAQVGVEERCIRPVLSAAARCFDPSDGRPGAERDAVDVHGAGGASNSISPRHGSKEGARLVPAMHARSEPQHPIPKRPVGRSEVARKRFGSTGFVDASLARRRASDRQRDRCPAPRPQGPRRPPSRSAWPRSPAARGR